LHSQIGPSLAIEKYEAHKWIKNYYPIINNCQPSAFTIMNQNTGTLLLHIKVILSLS
jgi:hypothetical protein